MAEGTLWDFPGSKWWRCDLHVHTPASRDFKDREATPEQWVQDALNAGLDVVAVTDHNHSEWIDRVQGAAKGTTLTILPGVEITAGGGVHLLAIFDRFANGQSVAALLGGCGFRGQDFGSDAVACALSPQEVLKVADSHKAICIAAHVDRPKGVLADLVDEPADGSPRGNSTLRAILISPHLLGLEVCDPQSLLLKYVDGRIPEYQRPLGPLPWLESSDAHSPQEIGRRFTWIKMSEPTLEGLRLALLDGELSVLRGCQAQGDPNACAESVIAELEISDARYIGRGQPFRLALSPWLNCLIGGRGTGKSTVVEFLRLCMRREQELEDLPKELQRDLEKYREAYENRADGGLLTVETVIRVVVRRGGSRFRISWSHRGDVLPIEEEDGPGAWKPAQGEVRARFPVRIFSQKQIFHLAGQPNALRKIIDESPEVSGDAWRSELEREERHFFALKARIRELQAETGDLPRLLGSLDDIRRKIEAFEVSSHREILSRFQVTQRQQRALDSWAGDFEDAVERLESVPGEILTGDLPEELFPRTVSPESPEGQARELIHKTEVDLEKLRSRVEDLAREGRGLLNRYHLSLESSPWPAHVAEAAGSYRSLEAELAASGVGDPSQYGRLVQERQFLEGRIREVGARAAMISDLDRQASQSLKKLAALRSDLTRRRQAFLERVLGDNELVKMEVVPYGDSQDAERRLRSAIGKMDQTFQDQIWSEDGEKGLLRELYAEFRSEQSPEAFVAALGRLKDRLKDLDASLHGKLLAHLRKLPAEAWDRIDILFPEDEIKASYRAVSRDSFRSIEQGSPGQKSAAILAFLLAHGEEPLILDQPEDDLDNSLIYELIVSQLRRKKRERQIIVVTHNPNIVVNADAELVVPLFVGGGQTLFKDAGGLQERRVREEIIDIMEGGREALERRYQRIRGGAAHV